ncbi:putative L-type lectin-domain containing receptor kinase S.5 [Tasmannia lanceolata]|uniref:putative L-type lectin-domain containing receptor kinase S.5 n=1 Tax=Tasmannia lanceolata TaxID=3420 RepID=UPI004063EB0B
MGVPEKLPIFLSTILLLNWLSISTAKNFSMSFSSFDSTNFTPLKDAEISNSALRITPDSDHSNFTLANRYGRAMISKPFRLWEGDILASFSTSFLINIFRSDNSTPGEGLVFVIAPDLQIPTGSYGQWLGLTNSTTDGNSSNQFIAVELDTFKEDFDPNDNHIGLNINSVVSNITYNLSLIGVQLAPEKPANYTIWVDYNGTTTMMDVYIAQQGMPKPNTSVIQRSLNLKEIIAQDSYFGFSASTGNTFQLNCVLSWNLTVEILPRKNMLKLKLKIGIPLIIGTVTGVLMVLCYYMYKKKIRDDPRFLVTLRSLPHTPREFRFKDLKKATNNFDEKNKLGQGGFGVVYKGVLAKENMEVAVKKFSRGNIKGKDDFLSELIIINRLRHKNLVRLVGWCHKDEMLLLVYNYLPNGSLDKHLFGGVEPLNWAHRYKIISGIASALHYLHDEYDQKVVHRDLKASNVMLDSEYNAHLGDFGLARALENSATSCSPQEGVAGTRGYIALECFRTGKATCESDVYGFGAVVLEVMCGQPALVNIEEFDLLVDWVWTLYREGRMLEAIDKRLVNNYVAEDAERLLMLGLACSHPKPSERPKVAAIVQIISKLVGPPWVPPIKPSFDLSRMEIAKDDESSVVISDRTSGWSRQYPSRENVDGHNGNEDFMP